MVAGAVGVLGAVNRRIRPAGGEALNTPYLCWHKSAYAAGRIPDVVAAPVGAGVARGFSVDAVGSSFYERPRASISKDRLKEAGRFLPIWSTRRRIPTAA